LKNAGFVLGLFAFGVIEPNSEMCVAGHTISGRAEERLDSGIECSETDRDTLLFFHTENQIEYENRAAPDQTIILATDQPTDAEA